MKNLKRILTLLFLCLFSTLFAQNEGDYQAVIYLNNGGIFRGEILKYEKGKELVLELPNGETKRFKHREIDRIEYEKISAPPVEIRIESTGSDSAMIDVIRLTNGSIFKGNIIESIEGEYYELQLAGGDVIRFDWEEIASIVQEEDRVVYYEQPDPFSKQRSKAEFKEKWREKRLEKRNVYAFKERGFYNIIFFSSTSGEQSGQFQFGLGLQNILGYKFKRPFGLGIGIGADTYSFRTGETIYPLYAEARGYLKEDINSFYYSMALGYGFAFKNKEEEIVKAQGGYMIHPSFGMRFGASADTNLLLDFGLKFQKANFTREFLFTGEREIKDVLYQRFTVRLGLIF